MIHIALNGCQTADRHFYGTDTLSNIQVRSSILLPFRIESVDGFSLDYLTSTAATKFIFAAKTVGETIKATHSSSKRTKTTFNGWNKIEARIVPPFCEQGRECVSLWEARQLEEIERAEQMRPIENERERDI